jgi:SET domain-containing protein
MGRYINHAAVGANLRLKPPIQARGKVRIGFVASKDINPGDELFFDYGYR